MMRIFSNKVTIKTVRILLVSMAILVVITILMMLYIGNDEITVEEYNRSFKQEADILTYSKEDMTVYKEVSGKTYVTVVDEDISEEEVRERAGIPDSVEIDIFVPRALVRHEINLDELYSAPPGYQE